MKTKDIITESIRDNIYEFVTGKKIEDLIDLYNYLATKRCMESHPTELGKKFIEEFFGNDRWAGYINERKKEHTSIFSYLDVDDTRNSALTFLSFEIIQLVGKGIADKSAKDRQLQKLKKEKETLKKELEQALDDSVDGGVFYKDDGFINLYEVLIRHNMVKERED